MTLIYAFVSRFAKKKREFRVIGIIADIPDKNTTDCTDDTNRRQTRA